MNFLNKTIYFFNKFAGHGTRQKRLITYLEQEKIRKDELLRNLLTYAKTYSPYYKNILKKIDIDRFSCEKLQELPTLTKATFMEQWDNIVTDNSLNLKKVMNHLNNMGEAEELMPLDDKYLVFSTGGSSGKKGIFLYPYQGMKQYATITTQQESNQYRRIFKLKAHEKLKTAIIIIKNTVYIAHAYEKLYTADNEIKGYFPINQPLDTLVKELNQFQPHLIKCLPSTCNILCNAALTGKLKINPKIIIVFSEPLYQPIRKSILKTWPSVKIYNIYGSTEGLSAKNCTADNPYLHLNDTAYFCFPVNQFNNPVENGSYCDKLIYTSLYNYTLPLINYEIEDRIRFIQAPCACGSFYPLIEAPSGRAAQDFIYQSNIRIHYLVFSTPLLTDAYVVEFQVKQTNHGAKIYIVANGPVNKQKILTAITKSYSSIGLANAQIEIFEVKSLPYLPSGKLRRFISL